MRQQNPTRYRNGHPICGHTNRTIRARDPVWRYPCGQLALAHFVSFAPASVKAWNDHFSGKVRIRKQVLREARMFKP